MAPSPEPGWRCSRWWIRAPGTSSPTSARRSCVISLRGRQWTSICSRNPTSTSGARSLGSGGRCCRRTAPASMGYRASSAPSTGSVSRRAFPCGSRWRIPTTPFASAPRQSRRCKATRTEVAHDSCGSPRLFAPRAGADPWARQCDVPAHAGLPGGYHPRFDPPDPPCAGRHDHDVFDHAGGHGCHASRIDPGRDWGDHRSGAGSPRLEDFLGYHMAASQLHPCLYLRGFVSQACPDHRRARLCYRPTGSPHDDHSGYLATTARDTGLLHALDLVVRDAWALGERGGAVAAGARRPPTITPARAGHATAGRGTVAPPPRWERRDRAGKRLIVLAGRRGHVPASGTPEDRGDNPPLGTRAP